MAKRPKPLPLAREIMRLQSELLAKQSELLRLRDEIAVKQVQFERLMRSTPSAAELDDFGLPGPLPSDDLDGNLTERVQTILDRAGRPMSAPEIAAQLGGGHVDSIRSALSKLYARGTVVRPAVGIYRSTRGGHSGAATGDSDD